MDKRKNPLNTESHRQCASCKLVKSRDEFPVSRDNHDGLFPYCKDCVSNQNAVRYQRNKDAIKRRRDELKQMCVDILGGKCERCGYDEFLAGLDFHHVVKKDGEISKLITRAMSGNKFYVDELIAEVQTCALLCACCHNALHAGNWQESEIEL